MLPLAKLVFELCVVGDTGLKTAVDELQMALYLRKTCLCVCRRNHFGIDLRLANCTHFPAKCTQKNISRYDMHKICTIWGKGAVLWCVLVRVSFVWPVSSAVAYILVQQNVARNAFRESYFIYSNHSTWLYLTYLPWTNFVTSPGAYVSITVWHLRCDKFVVFSARELCIMRLGIPRFYEDS